MVKSIIKGKEVILSKDKFNVYFDDQNINRLNNNEIKEIFTIFKNLIDLNNERYTKIYMEDNLVDNVQAKEKIFQISNFLKKGYSFFKKEHDEFFKINVYLSPKSKYTILNISGNDILESFFNSFFPCLFIRNQIIIRPSKKNLNLLSIILKDFLNQGKI